MPAWKFCSNVQEKIGGDAQQTLVLFGVRCSRRTEKRDPQVIALTGEPILGLRQYSHTVSIFAEICELQAYIREVARVTSEASNGRMYLVSAYFELRCVPCRVLVRRTSDVTPGRFIRRNVTMDVEWQLNCNLSVRVVGRYNNLWSHTLQKLMTFMPINLCTEYKLIEGVRGRPYQPV